jgi:hypothetical protein
MNDKLANFRHSGQRMLLRLIVITTVALQISCGVKAVEMNVVVFNYLPRPLADVYVNGQHVGAGFSEFGPGGTGGSISCCFNIKPGPIKVDWVIDGPLADPMTGKKVTGSTELREVKADAKYLGVYLYEDGSVRVDTARGIPADHPPAIKR